MLDRDGVPTALTFLDGASGAPRGDVFATTRVLGSSRELGWDGLIAEHGTSERFTPDDVVTPAHYCAINLGRTPVAFELAGPRGFTRRTLGPGALWIVPAGMPMTARNGASRWGALQLAPAKIERVLGRPLDVAPGFGIEDAALTDVVRALLAEVQRGGSAGALFADGLTTALIARLAQLGGAPPLPRAGALGPARLQRVTDRIEASLADALTIAELAATVDLSPAHFAREFKRATGQTPHAFVLDRRLARARRLLEDGAPVAQVATSVGFYDQSHLCRAFKRRFGISPGAARRRAH